MKYQVEKYDWAPGWIDITAVDDSCEKERVMGVIQLHFVQGVMITETINVLPHYRRLGIGRLLLEYASAINGGKIPRPGFIANTLKAKSFWASFGITED
jgi:GNAT superfamily N-acetyltransferase